MRVLPSNGWSRLDDVALASLPEDADRLAGIALAEDGPLDVTSELMIAGDVRGDAALQARSAGVLAGAAYADAVVRGCGLSPVEWRISESGSFSPGQTLGRIVGPLRWILQAERPLLNLLQRACSIATTTRSYVERLRGTRCRVLHTRKTLPGLRAFDVRAVLAGGGALHRVDLSREVLVKDNHWRALEALGGSLRTGRAAAAARGVRSFQVEVESQDQLEAACTAGATRILVDNQSPETLEEWAACARQLAPGIEVEASGGIDLANVRAYAEAGADFVSIGALTHSVRALDIALEVTAVEAGR